MAEIKTTSSPSTQPTELGGARKRRLLRPMIGMIGVVLIIVLIIGGVKFIQMSLVQPWTSEPMGIESVTG